MGPYVSAGFWSTILYYLFLALGSYYSYLPKKRIGQSITYPPPEE